MTTAVLTAAGIDLLICVVVMGLTAWVSWRVGRASVVDVAWGLAFVGVALVLAIVLGEWLSWLLAVLVTIWGGRLALHIFRRSRGHGEDPRYAALLGDAGFGTVIRKVFLVQGLAVFLVSLPLVTASAFDVRWRWLVVVGAAVWLVGLVFEASATRSSRPTGDSPRARSHRSCRPACGAGRDTRTTSVTRVSGGASGSPARCRSAGCRGC